MPLLEVSGLAVTDGSTTIVREIGLSMANGERVAIIGESGAGKSTVARAITGLLPAGVLVSGSVSFDGRQVLGDETWLTELRASRLGLILQTDRDNLDPLQTGIAHLEEAVRANDEAARRRTAEAWLGRVGLDPARARLFAGQLSPAERQGLVVALALAREPDLLVADNPAQGLDLLDQRRILDLIAQVCAERNMALLLISADTKAVAMLAERIVVLHGGQIVEAGNKTDVLGFPRHAYTRSVLNAGRLRQRTLMRTPIGETLLAARAVGRRFRKSGQPPFMLEGVSFEMRAGESLALFGTGGAGKSTLGRIVAGLERASKGELEFDSRIYHGTDLTPINRGDISFVFPRARDAFDPVLPVGTSIAEPLRLDVEGEVTDPMARIREVTSAVGLSPELLAALPSALTDAQLQAFALARALVTRPKLIVLDEPVLDLEIGARSEFLLLLDRLRADYGLTFLVLTRDLDTVRVLADRVLVLDRGHVVEAGTLAQLAIAAKHPVTQRLMAAALPDIGIVPVF